MSVVTLNQILPKALDNNYAVPAFNIWSFPEAKAFIKAANITNSPLILQVSGTGIAYNGLKFSMQIIKNALKEAKTPIVIHLDHAEDLELILKAINYGFSSIMYDGSNLSVEENISNCKMIKKITNAYKVTLEGEIGHIIKGEGDKEIITTPQDALEFIDKTQVDALAVAVGTRHGMQKQDAPIRLEAIAELSKAVNIPMVLHGSSGVSDPELEIVSKTGICKINIATRNRLKFIQGLKETTSTYEGHDITKVFDNSSNLLLEEACKIIKILGSDNKV